MSRISGKNTKPELTVRSLLHKMGYRFRLHKSDLPGKPDITLPKYKKVIFVHGCFWHGHKGCKRSKLPDTNRGFWEKKIHSNVERDQKNTALLIEKGWGVKVIWGCQTKDKDFLTSELINFINS